jgi:hypothetical protein
VRRRRGAKSLAVQLFELGVAAPQVIAHRMAACDAAEFQRMYTEKIAAVNEAWAAMATLVAVERGRPARSRQGNGAGAPPCGREREAPQAAHSTQPK